MSAEISTTANKSNIAGELGTSVMFGGLLTGGFGARSAISSHGGIKRAIEATKNNNRVLRTYADKIKDSGDSFTNSLKIANNYEVYTSLAKKEAKLAKKLAKINKKGKLPLFTRITNYFKKDENKITKEILQTRHKDASNTLRNAKAQLENGENIFETTKTTFFTHKTKKTALGHLADASSLKASSKALFKSELKDPLGIFSAIYEAGTRFTSDALPAFKNEGFSAGIKETAKALAAGGATLVSDAGFSVLFRTIGASIGTVIAPGVGSAIGSIVGNALGAFVSCKFIQKIFPSKSQTEKLNNEQTVQNSIEQTQISTNEIAQEESNAIQKDTTQETAIPTYYRKRSKYEGMPSRYKGNKDTALNLNA